MYAIIKTGGKQYRVQEGQILRVEKIDAEEGSTVQFSDILLVGNGSEIKIDSAALASSNVTADVIKQGRSRKIEVIKFRRRKHYRKHQGHRQHFTEIKITKIV